MRDGHLPLADLITIRRGELAHNPLTDRIEPVTQELVKLRGTGAEWCCCYYDPASRGCSIYRNRPVACGVLQCWQPELTLALVGRDLLSRLDLLAEDEALRTLVLEYERLCPGPDMGEVERNLADQAENVLSTLEEQVNRDLAFRDRVVRELHLPLALEMFLFGRPLFQLLQALGVKVSEAPQGLRLALPREGREGRRR
ncbi:MAG: putative Fe-S [Desulfobulbaceae bacterium]|nr:MAG: putative Fe-S [Desulfobulbaceae bacterium]